MAYSDLIIDGNPLGLQFGKACDTDMAENSVSIDDGTIAVIARQELFNSVYADEIQDGSYTTSAEHDNIMNGSVCSIRPKLQIGEDIIGDAYLTEEDVDTELASVGGVSGMTMQELMKQTKGSISKTLDLILAPDANPTAKSPKFSISITENKLMTDSNDYDNQISVSAAATYDNVVTFAVTNDASATKTKNVKEYTFTTEPEVTYTFTPAATGGVSNADITVTVSAERTYTNCNFGSSPAYLASTKKGITDKDANTTWSAYLGLNSLPASSTVQATAKTCRMYAPFFVGYAGEGDETNAENYIGTSIVNVRNANFTQAVANVNTASLFTASQTYSGTVKQTLVVCMPTGIIPATGTQYPASTKYNNVIPFQVISSGSDKTSAFVNTNATFTYNGITYNIWKQPIPNSSDGWSTAQFNINVK